MFAERVKMVLAKYTVFTVRRVLAVCITISIFALQLTFLLMKSTQRLQHHSLRTNWSSLQPQHHSLQTNWSSGKPEHHSLQPNWSSRQSEHHSLQPSWSTRQPEHHSLQPSWSTRQPEHHSLQPNWSSRQSEHHSLQPSWSTRQPEYHSLQTNWSSGQPEHHSLQPNWSSRQSVHHSLQPSWSTRQPGHHSLQTNWSSGQPEHHSIQPNWSSRQPEHHGLQANWPARQPEPPKRQQNWLPGQPEHHNRQLNWSSQQPGHHSLQTNWSSRKPEQHVILLAYMRSGSSFVGNVLQHNLDMFYVFEPLRQLEKAYFNKIKTPITFLYKPPFFTNERNYGNVQNEYLTNLLSCNFINIDVDTLIQEHWARGRTTHYSECIDGKNSTTHISNILKCLFLLYNECNERRVSLAKVIRYQMVNTEHMLNRDEKLKLLHLVRDPRAILSSRHRLGFLDMAMDIQNHSRILCDEMYHDVKRFQELIPKYSNRMKLVRYEDIVENPIEEFKNLYQFIDISFGDAQRDYINSLTNQTGRTCSYCVTSKKSIQTAHAWRYTIPLRVVNIIDENCAKVYDFLGYKNIEKEADLLNSEFQFYENKNHTKYLRNINSRIKF